MTIQECYERLHGNYSAAKRQLMNDTLIRGFILKFPMDDSVCILREGIKTGDREKAFRGAHTLKGVAANLAFSELQEAAEALTEQLRDGKEDADTSLIEKVEESYSLVICTLGEYSQN